MRVWGFSAAGEVIYTSLDARPGAQLFALDTQTGQRRQLPVGQGSDGALSADGKTLYFTRSGLRGDNARQYRGGAIARLWSLDLTAKTEARTASDEAKKALDAKEVRDLGSNDKLKPQINKLRG
jgi:tricorn protease